MVVMLQLLILKSIDGGNGITLCTGTKPFPMTGEELSILGAHEHPTPKTDIC